MKNEAERQERRARHIEVFNRFSALAEKEELGALTPDDVGAISYRLGLCAGMESRIAELERALELQKRLSDGLSKALMAIEAAKEQGQ